MRSLRAVYNHARKSNTDLPPVNPVTAIDWNKERRRNTGMRMNDVGGWLKELHALPNPLRRIPVITHGAAGNLKDLLYPALPLPGAFWRAT
jgi:hypothetical protein